MCYTYSVRLISYFTDRQKYRIKDRNAENQNNESEKLGHEEFEKAIKDLKFGEATNRKKYELIKYGGEHLRLFKPDTKIYEEDIILNCRE